MRTIALVPLAVLAFALPLRAEVKLPTVFSDHMVLQRETPVPVWGTAAPGEKVTVTFRDQAKTAVADAGGKWAVSLEPLKAGGPDRLVVNTRTFEDVLVGEVWLGAGQSNMGVKVGNCVASCPEFKDMLAAGHPQIRLNREGGWAAAEPPGPGGFSAILFSFGHRLQGELRVPVGLIARAAGGSSSGLWISREGVERDAGCRAAVASYAAEAYPALQKKYQENLARWEKAAAEADQAGRPRPGRPGPPQEPGKISPTFEVGALFESKVRPLVGFAIRGVLWDQGETGVGVGGLDQTTTMPALIAQWRRDWGREFPWIYVQKPSGGGCAWDTTSPITRAAERFQPLPRGVPNDGQGMGEYLGLMRIKDTWMAQTSDLGEGIHPLNKHGYGHRAAEVALVKVYGRAGPCHGPAYLRHRVDASRVVVEFDNVGQGLAFRHGEKLQGFALAGADRKFHWAEAAIDGNTVVLTAAEVSQPEFVRYGWSGNRRWANLFNKNGLPAIPFRTDLEGKKP
jgi:sialate O-acetylesterase